MRHVTYMDESRHACARVPSHICMRHVTHLIESCHLGLLFDNNRELSEVAGLLGEIFYDFIHTFVLNILVGLHGQKVTFLGEGFFSQNSNHILKVSSIVTLYSLSSSELTFEKFLPAAAAKVAGAAPAKFLKRQLCSKFT